MSKIPMRPCITWSHSSETGEVTMIIRKVDPMSCVVETMRVEDVSPQMFHDLASEAHIAAGQVQKVVERTNNWQRIEKLVEAKQLVDTIKELRSVTGMDLLQAKLTAESMMRLCHKTGRR